MKKTLYSTIQRWRRAKATSKLQAGELRFGFVFVPTRVPDDVELLRNVEFGKGGNQILRMFFDKHFKAGRKSDK